MRFEIYTIKGSFVLGNDTRYDCTLGNVPAGTTATTAVDSSEPSESRFIYSRSWYRSRLMRTGYRGEHPSGNDKLWQPHGNARDIVRANRPPSSRNSLLKKTLKFYMRVPCFRASIGVLIKISRSGGNRFFSLMAGNRANMISRGVSNYLIMIWVTRAPKCLAKRTNKIVRKTVVHRVGLAISVHNGFGKESSAESD